MKFISTCLGLSNMAFLQSTKQSTTRAKSNVTFNSSFGVDGKINQLPFSPYQACAMTEPGAGSWWQVDLVTPKNVGVVSWDKLFEKMAHLFLASKISHASLSVRERRRFFLEYFFSAIKKNELVLLSVYFRWPFIKKKIMTSIKSSTTQSVSLNLGTPITHRVQNTVLNLKQDRMSATQICRRSMFALQQRTVQCLCPYVKSRYTL